MASAAALDKYNNLCADLADRRGGVAVAFSGGVDSSLLLFAAQQCLGPAKAQGIIASSPLLARGRLQRAKSFCQEINSQLAVVELDPLGQLADFHLNSSRRCYLCKRFIYEQLAAFLPPARALLDGTNVDDLKQERPGRQALKELGVATPLLQAGLTKNNIRNLSKYFGLSSWDLPADSCLATRIPPGEMITRERLQLIDKVETFLGKLGVYGCRANVDNRNLFLTVKGGQRGAKEAERLADKLLAEFSPALFTKVFLDLSE
ncbi:MAG: ATP-dependent sacrificial sulfur transferase LarE [Thermodesulfobacteriota bacterium]